MYRAIFGILIMWIMNWDGKRLLNSDLLVEIEVTIECENIDHDIVVSASQPIDANRNMITYVLAPFESQETAKAFLARILKALNEGQHTFVSKDEIPKAEKEAQINIDNAKKKLDKFIA